MGLVLLCLTNLIFPLAALGVVLSFLLSPRRKLIAHLSSELKERFGLIRADQVPPQAVWLHCASVGEVNAVRGLIKELKTVYKKPILVTTSTQAGKETAQKNPDISCALLAPLDFYPSCARFIRVAQPYRLFVVEREIWPNMLQAAHQAHLPAALINGRISQKSARAYGLIKPLFKQVLAPLAFAALQTQEDAKRYEALGIPADKIHVLGNVKYDALSDKPAQLPRAHEILEKLGWLGHPIFVAGSTHPEEETLLLRTVPELLKSGTKLIFAPRHLERMSEIEHTLQQSGLHYALAGQDSFDKSADVLCVNVMGLLCAFYACATLTFVGGSIVQKGAHNLLEPALLGKTVLFGKYFFNTPDTAKALLEHGGGVLVSPTNFKETVVRLLADREQLDNMNAHARQTAQSFQGATAKTIGVITAYEQRTNA